MDITRHRASRNHGPTEVRYDDSHARQSHTVPTEASQQASRMKTALQGINQSERKGLTRNTREQEQNGQTTGSKRAETTASSK